MDTLEKLSLQQTSEQEPKSEVLGGEALDTFLNELEGDNGIWSNDAHALSVVETTKATFQAYNRQRSSDQSNVVPGRPVDGEQLNEDEAARFAAIREGIESAQTDTTARTDSVRWVGSVAAHNSRERRAGSRERSGLLRRVGAPAVLVAGIALTLLTTIGRDAEPAGAEVITVASNTDIPDALLRDVSGRETIATTEKEQIDAQFEAVLEAVGLDKCNAREITSDTEKYKGPYETTKNSINGNKYTGDHTRRGSFAHSLDILNAKGFTPEQAIVARESLEYAFTFSDIPEGSRLSLFGDFRNGRLEDVRGKTYECDEGRVAYHDMTFNNNDTFDRDDLVTRGSNDVVHVYTVKVDGKWYGIKRVFRDDCGGAFTQNAASVELIEVPAPTTTPTVKRTTTTTAPATTVTTRGTTTTKPAPTTSTTAGTTTSTTGATTSSTAGSTTSTTAGTTSTTGSTSTTEHQEPTTSTSAATTTSTSEAPSTTPTTEASTTTTAHETTTTKAEETTTTTRPVTTTTKQVTTTTKRPTTTTTTASSSTSSSSTSTTRPSTTITGKPAQTLPTGGGHGDNEPGEDDDHAGTGPANTSRTTNPSGYDNDETRPSSQTTRPNTTTTKYASTVTTSRGTRDTMNITVTTPTSGVAGTRTTATMSGVTTSVTASNNTLPPRPR